MLAKSQHGSSPHLSLSMIQNVIVFLLVRCHDSLETHKERIDSFDLNIPQTAETLHDVEHIHDAFQSLTEGIKFTKNVVLTGREKRNILNQRFPSRTDLLQENYRIFLTNYGHMRFKDHMLMLLVHVPY